MTMIRCEWNVFREIVYIIGYIYTDLPIVCEISSAIVAQSMCNANEKNGARASDRDQPLKG